MNSKLLLLALALSIATPAIVIPMAMPTEVTADAPPKYKKVFTDVTTKNVNYDIIHSMAEQGIIKGYSDNTFRGANSITRYQAATLIYRYMGGKLKVENPNVKIPSDVSPKSDHYTAMVAVLKAGLLKADSKGKLNPNKPITRAEMAKILVKTFDLKVKADYDFADTIEGDKETQNYVRALYSNGITTGYLEDATFRPDKSLTRSNFAVFMHRSINVDPNYVAPPIVIPEKPEPTKPETSKPSSKFPAGSGNETLVIPKATPGYDRYDVNNMEKTPMSELEGLPTSLSAIKNTNRYYDKSITGMSLDDYKTFVDKHYESYKRILIPNSTITMGTSDFKYDPPLLQGMADQYMDGDVDKFVQVMYYVYSTNAMFKNEYIQIAYVYQAENRGVFKMSLKGKGSN